ncbi:hypothetical protein ACLOAV_003802 [Pseudogymnoascus australis]
MTSIESSIMDRERRGLELDALIGKSRRGDDEVRRQTLASIEGDMIDSMNSMVQKWTILMIGKSQYHGRKMQVARLGNNKVKEGDDEVRRQTMTSIKRSMLDLVSDMVQKWTLERQITKSRRGDDNFRRRTMASIESSMLDLVNDMVQKWTL